MLSVEKNKKKNQENNNTQTWKHRRTSTKRRPSKLVQFSPPSLCHATPGEGVAWQRERGQNWATYNHLLFLPLASSLLLCFW